MKRWQLLNAVVVMSMLCALANAQPASLNISIDNDDMDVPLRYIQHSDGYGGHYEIGEIPGEKFAFETEEGRIELEGMLDPDPALFFAGVAFDFGGASSFGYTFIMPLVPTYSNPSIVRDSFSGSVTNGATAGSVTVTALPPPLGIPVDGDAVTEMQVYTLSDDSGATWKNVGLDLGPSATISPLGVFASGVYGDFNEGPIPTIAGGPWTHMRADINFMLSGGGDLFTFNGAKLLVPEPSTLALAMLLLGAFCWRWRRHSSR